MHEFRTELALLLCSTLDVLLALLPGLCASRLGIVQKQKNTQPNDAGHTGDHGKQLALATRALLVAQHTMLVLFLHAVFLPLVLPL